MTEKQMQRNQEYKLNNVMQRALSLEVAKPFCKSNGLSFDKLKKQRFDFIYGTAIFSQPSGVEPKGLTNDKETMPLPTLIIKNIDGEIVFEQTEYTEQYLAQ
ncbi:MAG: hypothetical protein ACI4GY_09385 [Acutalibacteraceae bacterium]